MHSMERGVNWSAFDWWDSGVFEALHELVDGGVATVGVKN